MFHFFMGVGLTAVSIFVSWNKGDMVVIAMSFVIVCFQASNGSGLWVYCGEVAHEVAMGIVLLFLMGLLLTQSLFCTPLIDWIGMSGFFSIFAVF